ncbi:hypothetical protein CPB83DRAFT_908855 [Crepidotus variabilis]|uniref:Uncharacterized protein n=1 Tax=Crepidotus variabilis TaxID=179855 RepID=A0A9P6JMI8_9AGAR|nr:hypothetical protein CPB83DRAFT_908855 [Crepidotus variabilis]
MDTPTELLDHIFSFLRDDIASLRTSFSASKLLKQIAERHFYAHVKLSSQEPGNNNSHQSTTLNQIQLENLLAERPHIAPYIKSIEAAITEADIIFWKSNPSKDDTGGTVISTPQLPSLQMFCISPYDPWHHKRIVWDVIPSLLRMFWENLIRLPTIEKIAIHKITGFPVEMLDRCSKLICLSFQDVELSCALPAQSDFSVLTPITQLRHLTLFGGHEPLRTNNNWLLQGAGTDTTRVSHLSSLHFRTKNIEDFDFLNRIAGSCSRTLRELTVEIAQSPGSTSCQTSYLAESSSADPMASNLIRTEPNLDTPCLNSLGWPTTLEKI